MLNGIIRWALGNRLLVVAVALVLLIVGMVEAIHAPVDVLPTFSPPRVSVRTESPGLSAQQVEQQVTVPLENSLLGLSNVADVRSKSIEGLSAITVYFQGGTNIWTDRQLVAEAVASVASLPPTVQSPRLGPVTSAIGMTVVLGMTDAHAAAHPYRLRTLADWVVRRRLLAVPGVANVTVFGGKIMQYQVVVSPDRLRHYGLTLEQVLQATAQAGVIGGGGIYHRPSQELIVHTSSRIHGLNDLRQTVVAESRGVAVRLGDVATIQAGAAPRIGDATVNGQRGVVLQVFKQPWANTLSLTREVDSALRGLRPALPAAVRIKPDMFRQSTFIHASVHELDLAILEGGLLLMLVLLLFLRSPRAAVISLTAIPLSLLAAVLVMLHFGQSLNAMTLGGLLLALGEVVDDAIIDVENIARRLRENQQLPSSRPVWRVVYAASSEVRTSVVFATLIVVTVFIPVLVLRGVEGRIFAPLAEAYIFSILASLLVALTLTPVLSAWLLPAAASAVEENRFALALKHAYRRLVEKTLPYPAWIGAAALVAAAGALWGLLSMGGEFLPPFHEDNVILHMTSLPGTSLDENVAVGLRLERKLLSIPGVMSIDQRAGRAQLGEDTTPLNYSEFDIRLRPGQRRQTVAQIRAVTREFPGFTWALKGFIGERMGEVLAGDTSTVAIKIYGGNLQSLQRLASEVGSQVAQVRGTIDLQVPQQTSAPELNIRFRRRAAQAFGITSADLVSAVQGMFFDIPVGRVFQGQESFELVVRTPPATDASRAALGQMLVAAPGHQPVPLASVANLDFQSGPQEIDRENGSRLAVVSCNVFGRSLTRFVDAVRARVAAHVLLPSGYYLRYAGAYRRRATAARRLRWLSLLAMGAIALLLYLAFHSTRSMLLVLFNIPLAFLGGVAAVWLSTAPVSLGTLIGFITLLGITTRNGIMLVSHFRHLEDREEVPFGPALVVRGALERLVPILMTATATGLALAPILLGGQQSGRELELPMAVVIVGGLFTSTVLNLLVLPALYLRYGRASSDEMPTRSDIPVGR